MQLFLHHEELLTTNKYVDKGIVSNIYSLHPKENQLPSQHNQKFIIAKFFKILDDCPLVEQERTTLYFHNKVHVYALNN